MTPDQVTAEHLVEFVYREARLLDARDFESWNKLFTDDAIYWVPLTPDQPPGLEHTSHMYEDKLLRELRIERFKSPRAFSQQPPSRCHHLLQQPHVETLDAAANHFVTRTEFHYSESSGDEMLMLVGTAFHHLRVDDGALRITLKRVNLLNCDAALPPVQLFI
ncbi:aromatic-ring-hydroxylating dioxygenase subunit beta [Piscinibacter sakaiensis]|uniref:aromatic-ring-hydroxylating dioxygenase subunit beta n=1 Tax=Piscinibacter sakaiensis TaxID=1547922 RepID=UPI003AAFC504